MKVKKHVNYSIECKIGNKWCWVGHCQSKTEKGAIKELNKFNQDDGDIDAHRLKRIETTVKETIIKTEKSNHPR